MSEHAGNKCLRSVVPGLSDLEGRAFDKSDALRYIRLFVIGVIMQLNAGSLYAFSIYGPSLKHALSLSQSQISTVASFGNIGVFSGALIGALHDQFGVVFTSTVAACLVAVGYFCVYASFMRLFVPPVALLCVFTFVIGQGNHGLYIASLVTNVKNFPSRDRGKVVGIMVACFGLSASLFTEIFEAAFAHTHVGPFLLFMCFCTASAGILGALTLRVMPRNVSTNYKAFDDDAEAADEKSALASTTDNHTGGGSRTQQQQQQQQQEEEEEETQQNRFDFREFFAVFRSVVFWRVFFLFFLIVGSAVFVINNVGSMVISLGGKHGSQDILVVLISLFSFLGRLLAGLLTDAFASVPKSTFLLISAISVTIGHVLALIEPLQLLPIVCVFVGSAYGIFFSIVPTILSLEFPVSKLGLNYGLAVLGGAFGVFGFGFVSGEIYDAHVPAGAHTHICTGVDCFQSTFIITSIAGIVAIAVAYSQLRHERASTHVPSSGAL